MSQLVVNDYTFNKTAKTIRFNSYNSIRLEGVMLVTNVTSNTIIYNFADPSLGGSVVGNTLTLDYDTSAMSDSDSISIIYNPPSGGFFDLVYGSLRQLIDLVRFPSYVGRSAGLDKVQVLSSTDSAIGTINTVTTVSNVSVLTSMNGMNPQLLFWNAWQTEYNTGIRSKIT